MESRSRFDIIRRHGGSGPGAFALLGRKIVVLCADKKEELRFGPRRLSM